jgi:hypothetical protein
MLKSRDVNQSLKMPYCVIFGDAWIVCQSFNEFSICNGVSARLRSFKYNSMKSMFERETVERDCA